MKFSTAGIALLAAPMLADALAFPVPVAELETRQTTTTVPPRLNDRNWIANTLSVINAYRIQYDAVPFQWNSKLATYSQTAANNCQLKHTGGPYSENIYMSTAKSVDFYQQTKAAFDAWMSESVNYKDPDNPQNANDLHFTALVWKNSTRIGCGWSQGCSTGIYFYCEMDPQGNILPYFRQYVKGP